MLLGDLGTIATYDLPVQVIVSTTACSTWGTGKCSRKDSSRSRQTSRTLTSPSSPTRKGSSGSASAATLTCPERAAPEIARSGGLRTGAEIHAKPAEAR
jgi:hypothetical protein